MILSRLGYSLLFVFFTQCSVLGILQDRVPKPEFSFSDLKIKKITLIDITLEITTSVYNPYPLSLPKSLLAFDLQIEKNKLTSIKTDLGQIKAKETRNLPFEVKIAYLDLLKIYQSLPGKALLTVGVEGQITVPLPESIAKLGQDSLTVPFKKEREIPAVLPDVAIGNFSIEMPTKEEVLSTANTEAMATTALSFLEQMLNGKTKTQAVKSASQAGIAQMDLNLNTNFNLNFQNKAASELLFQGLAYDLNLGGEKFLQGKPTEIINNGKESIVKVNTSFPVSSISQGLYKTIQSRTANFNLTGDSKLGVPGLKEILPFQYEKNGRFQW